MLRHFTLLVCCLSLTLASPSRAEDGLFDEDDLFAAIEARDHLAVETAFTSLQQRQRAGELNGDYLRSLFSVFATNNPDIVEFATGWLESEPESAFAHIALAWIHFQTGWNVRGTKLAREIYPAALDEFGLRHEKAWEHAWAAYQTDPLMFPASDALLMLANSTGRKEQAYEVLYEVMTAQPEMGTLRRALGMTIPGWGGTWPQAQELCDFYGPMIEWEASDPVLHCKVYAALSYHGAEAQDWAIKELASGALPELDHFRAYHATSLSATRADAVFAREYLTREGIIDHDIARRFDEHVAMKYGYDFLSEEHLRKARASAARMLERDPYNLANNKFMKKSVSRFERTDTYYRVVVVERPTVEEELEYARRILISSPFDPEHWQDYGRLVARMKGKRGFIAAEPYNINTIVFSNHSPGRLIGYAFEKWNMLAAFQRLDTDHESEMWQSLDQEQRAMAEETRQEWLALREQISLDETLRCPMMRAYRLHEVVCNHVKNSDCEISGDQEAMYEIVRADVTQRRVCTGIMSADPVDLFYQPVEVDLEGADG